MKIVVSEPGSRPFVEDLRNDVESIYEVLYCNDLEAISPFDDPYIVLIFNTMAKKCKAKHNRFLFNKYIKENIYGDFIITRVDPDTHVLLDLSDIDLKKCLEAFKNPHLKIQYVNPK